MHSRVDGYGAVGGGVVADVEVDPAVRRDEHELASDRGVAPGDRPDDAGEPDQRGQQLAEIPSRGRSRPQPGERAGGQQEKQHDVRPRYRGQSADQARGPPAGEAGSLPCPRQEQQQEQVEEHLQRHRQQLPFEVDERTPEGHGRGRGSGRPRRRQGAQGKAVEEQAGAGADQGVGNPHRREDAVAEDPQEGGEEIGGTSAAARRRGRRRAGRPRR